MTTIVPNPQQIIIKVITQSILVSDPHSLYKHYKQPVLTIWMSDHLPRLSLGSRPSLDMDILFGYKLPDPTNRDILFGYKLPDPTKPQQHCIYSNTETMVKQFSKMVVDGFLHHNLFNQIYVMATKEQFTQDNHNFLNTINKHITTIIIKADWQCQWLNMAPWSSELHQAYLIHWYWVLWLSKKCAGCNFQQAYKHIAAALLTPLDTTGSISKNLAENFWILVPTTAYVGFPTTVSYPSKPIPTLFAPFQCFCHSISLHFMSISPLYMSLSTKPTALATSHCTLTKSQRFVPTTSKFFYLCSTLSTYISRFALPSTMVTRSSSSNKRPSAKGVPCSTSKSNLLKQSKETKSAHSRGRSLSRSNSATPMVVEDPQVPNQVAALSSTPSSQDSRSEAPSGTQSSPPASSPSASASPPSSSSPGSQSVATSSPGPLDQRPLPLLRALLLSLPSLLPAPPRLWLKPCKPHHPVTTALRPLAKTSSTSDFKSLRLPSLRTKRRPQH